jgi:hypothetical protein
MTTFNGAEGVSDLYQLTFDLADPNAIDANFVGTLSETVVGLAWDQVDPTIIQGLGAAPANNLDIIDDTTALDSPFPTDLGLGFDILDGGLDFDPSTAILWGIDDGSGAFTGKARPRAGKAHPHGITGQSTLFSIDPGLGTAVDVVGVTDADGNPLAGFDNLAIGPPAGGGIPNPCSGTIRVNVKRLKFGTVKVNHSRVRGFVIRNRSADEVLTITDIELDKGTNYEIANGTGPIDLEPGQSRTVAVRFIPINRGGHFDTVFVSSTDCDTGDVIVHLQGHGQPGGRRKK